MPPESRVSKSDFYFLTSYSFLGTRWGWLPLKEPMPRSRGPPSCEPSELRVEETMPVLWIAVFPVAGTTPGTQSVLGNPLLTVFWHEVLFDLSIISHHWNLSSFPSRDDPHAGFCPALLRYPFSFFFSSSSHPLNIDVQILSLAFVSSHFYEKCHKGHLQLDVC